MKTRTETDSMGAIEVSADRYYGAQDRRVDQPAFRFTPEPVRRPLCVLLILLVVDIFIVAPIAQGATSVVQPVVHSIVLVSGIAIASRCFEPNGLTRWEDDRCLT